MNVNKARAKGASELQQLTTEPYDALSRPEMARAELATCARGGAVVHGDGTAVPATAIRRQGLGCGEHGDDQLEEGLGEQGIGTGCFGCVASRRRASVRSYRPGGAAI